MKNTIERLTSGTTPIFEEYKGYQICALPHSEVLSFFPDLGKANGYIVIPEFNGKDYDDIPCGSIHGGFTFAEESVFGFDTLHINSNSDMDEKWVLQHLKEYIDEVLIND